MKLLKELVRINSVSGNEQRIQNYIFKTLTSFEYNPKIRDGNVVLSIKGNNSQKALIFNAHVDTVHPGDLKFWKSDPFFGTRKGGKVYGLGASDEKATIAGLILLAKHFRSHKPACDLWLTFVVNEELDGSGTKNFLNWFVTHNKYKKVAGILGEPTNLKQIEIAHKGNLFLKITTTGDSGHASEPERLKKSAIKNMLFIVQKMKQISKNWEMQYSDILLGKPTISLTSLNAGDQTSPNKFPESCTAVFDIRTTPKLHSKAVELTKSALKKSEAKFELLFEPAPFGYTDKSSEIVKIAESSSGAKINVSPSSNDMCFFTEKGIPAIVYGPGNHNVIHKPNEYCEIKNINDFVIVLKEVIERFGII